MSLLKSLAGETAVYGLSFIIGRVLNWIVLGLYLTHKLNTLEYGIFNEMYFYVALALILLVYRLETTSFRYAQQEGEDRVFGTAFWHVSVGGALLWGFWQSLLHACGITERPFALPC